MSENAAGKWVPLEVFAVRKGISKATVYKLIHRGDLTRRASKSGTEVFAPASDSGFFEDMDSSPISGGDDMDSDIKLNGEDDYGIASQSLQTVLAMHKEVLAEKQRLLSEWEAERAKQEEKLLELQKALAERDEKLTDKNAELRQLRHRVQVAEETARRLQADLEETRLALRRIDELAKGSERDWSRMEKLLDEKDALIRAKGEIIYSMETSFVQKEEAFHKAEQTIAELKEVLEKFKGLIKEKEETIRMLDAEPLDLEGKLADRDQTIEELRTFIRALEQQLDSMRKSRDLTGFAEETPTTSLIQDQLEYLMADKDAQQYLGDQEAIAPVEESEIGKKGSEE